MGKLSASLADLIGAHLHNLKDRDGLTEFSESKPAPREMDISVLTLDEIVSNPNLKLTKRPHWTANTILWKSHSLLITDGPNLFDLYRFLYLGEFEFTQLTKKLAILHESASFLMSRPYSTIFEPFPTRFKANSRDIILNIKSIQLSK